MPVGKSPQLGKATAKLTQARTYVHAFSFPAVEPILQQGATHADDAQTQGQEAIHEFHFRRHGLWVTLVIIGVVILLLVLRIRELERANPDD